jgi:hypothetical protein
MVSQLRRPIKTLTTMNTLILYIKKKFTYWGKKDSQCFDTTMDFVAM